MAEKKILEGLWDCPYCKTKAIGGLTKHCPCCGHPQDTDIEFYLGEEKKYLETELAQEYGQGADWVCGYCGALNRVRFKYCSNCGGVKDASEKDYFKASEEKAAKAAEQAKQNEPPQKSKGKSKLLIFLALAAIILAVVFWPHNVKSQVSAKSWLRSVAVEAERTVEENDWSLPDGGRLLRTAEEIHHYDNVLDHYETRSRQVSERVYDGEDYYTEYHNNGDGTFTEVEQSRPRYRTEYHTEYYEDPVYVPVARYATKYYYEIERWVYDRTVTSEGGADEPYWPDCSLKDKEREGQKLEYYELSVADGKEKTYTFETSQSKWSSLKIGDKVKLTIVNGRVTKLNDEPLR